MGKHLRSIIVLRFGAVGDVINLARTTHALKQHWPSCRVVLVVRRGLGGLASQLPGVDHVVEASSFLALAQSALRADPMALLDLHGSLRSYLFRFFLPGVPVVRIHKRPWWEKLQVMLGGRAWAKKSLEERYCEAASRLVGERLALKAGGWTGAGEVKELVAGLSGPILGLSPGAAWDIKRWGGFGELTRLASEAGWAVVVAGGPGEEELCRQTSGKLLNVRNLWGNVPLTLLARLWQSCAVVVANDSGPLHLARAVGVPVVAVFGPTDPALLEGLSGDSQVWLGLECSPCSFFGGKQCPKGHHRCMTEIPASLVWERVLKVYTPASR